MTEFVMIYVPITTYRFLSQNERGPDHIKLLYSTITKSVFILANSADPDETPRFLASHLGLSRLYMTLFARI